MTDQAIKTALVTGAARGIGLATAKRFLAEGWQVGLLDIDGEGLARAAAEIGQPDRTLVLTCDVADPAQLESAFAGLAKRFGRLDALVNNAGTAVFKPLLETTHEEWQRVLAVNLTGPFLATQLAAPLMADHGGGAIVNITSISGLRASTLRVAYGTSKAALAHLTKQQAAELAGLGIRVNAVAPGPVETGYRCAGPAAHRHRPRRRCQSAACTLACADAEQSAKRQSRWRLRCGRHRAGDAARRKAEPVGAGRPAPGRGKRPRHSGGGPPGSRSRTCWAAPVWCDSQGSRRMVQSS